MKPPTTSLRTLFGPVMADALCLIGDSLTQAWKQFDPTWPLADTMAQAAMASAVLSASRKEEWPDDRDEREDMLFFNYSAMQWARWSRPTFVLTKELCAALLLTDCRGLKGRDLKFPFSSFVLSLPKEAGVFVVDEQGKPWPVTVMTAAICRSMQRHQVNEEADLFGKMCDAVLEKGLPKDPKILDSLRVAARYAHEKLVPHTEPWSVIRLLSPEHPTWLALHRVYNLPAEDESLERWLAPPRHIKGPLSVGSDEEHVLSMAHRLMANFVIYLNAHTMPTPERQSSILKKKSKSNQDAKIYRVGGDVHLPGHMIHAAWSAMHRQKHPTQWRVQSRFVVRGHWRNQAHGPERSLRKRLWIQPFWKGPTAEESLSRIYTTE